MKLTHNMGSIDRWVRGLIIAPGAAVAAVLIGPTTVPGILLAAVGVIMLATAVVGMSRSTPCWESTPTAEATTLLVPDEGTAASHTPPRARHTPRDLPGRGR